MNATRTINRHTVIAIAAVGVLLLAGTAFTAAVDTSTASVPTAGYGEVTATGATLESLSFTSDAIGENVTDAALVFTGDLTGKTVTINFDGATAKSCTVGTYDEIEDATDASCSALAQSTVTVGTVGISVTS